MLHADLLMRRLDAIAVKLGKSLGRCGILEGTSARMAVPCTRAASVSGAKLYGVMPPRTEDEEGAELVIELPACWSTEIRRDGNVARQLLAPAMPGRVEGDTRTGLRVESETGSFRLRRSHGGLGRGRACPARIDRCDG